MKLDELKNPGIYILNKTKRHKKKTVIVLGIARSGTTMLAEILSSIGIFMGEKLGAVKEDVELANMIEREELEKAKHLINIRNQYYDIWGWKRPEAFEYYDLWKDLFRNPYIIIIFRDPLSVALRNMKSMNLDVMKGLNLYQKKLSRLIYFIDKIKEENIPIMLISYEKALLNAKEFLENLFDFLDLNKNEEKLLNKALSAINPSSEKYLDEARITKAIGAVDVITEKHCNGWAFYVHRPEVPAKIKVYVNGNMVGETLANLHRKDIKEKGIHSTGNVGFSFTFPSPIKESDKIEVWVEGEVKPLPILKEV